MTARYVPARTRRWFRFTGWLALALLLQQPAGVLAQAAGGDVRLQGGDEIVLTVPGRPDLDGALTLDAGGRVTIPQVGEVALGGLTLPEAREILRQRLRVFYPSVGAVDVSLASETQVRLYVIGAVRTAGHYDFAAVPGVWDLLRAAGGPNDGADLARSRIVRSEGTSTEVLEVDLSGVLDGRGAPELELRAGDTLVVPAGGDAGTAVPAASGVQVFGAVGDPTVVPLNEPTELVQVLMLAGAPAPGSDLRKVQWVHRGPDGFRATRVDVRRFLEAGDVQSNPLIYPGDTLEVAAYQESWFARRLPVILGLLATAATVALAYDRIANN